MKHIVRADGAVTFTLPDTIPEPQDLRDTVRKRGASADDPINDEIETVLSALKESGVLDTGEQNFDVIDEFSLDLGDSAKAVQRTRSPARFNRMKLDVKLAPNEEAVILIEQDGTYEWHFSEKTVLKHGPRKRGNPAAIEKKNVVFSIPVGEGEPPKTKRNSKRVHRGPITNFILGKIKGFVLKFVAKRLVGPLSGKLEKGVIPGPVIISSFLNTDSWRHANDYLDVALPDNRPARILLLVHGTFSSTLGSFGALTAHPSGQHFLSLAFAQYDAVLGYDHFTLSETPAQNAEAIFEKLHELQQQSQGIEVDTIAFSRGGLVYRYLTEQIVPLEQTKLTFRKAIFVGCTNAGTELANDDNWKHLVDFYTNMVAGTSRLLGLIPGAKLPTLILSQAIQLIGSLVQYMAQEAIANNGVPGLAAMEPQGNFVLGINQPPVSRTRPGARAYYAIGSNFEPTEKTSAGELGKRLKLKVADGLVDRLMGEDNDLVVDSDSMFIIDPVPSAHLVESLPFGENGEIYHTVYFNQPEVARHCSDWLGLVQAANGLKENTSRSWWNGAVSDNFCVFPGDTRVADVLHRLKNKSPRFVVIERPHGGELFHYGIATSVLREKITSANKNADLVDCLDLHEYQSTGISLEEALSVANAQELQERSAMHVGEYGTVIIDEQGPVGVVAAPEVLSADALAMNATSPKPPSKMAKKKVARKKVSKKRSRGVSARGGDASLATEATSVGMPAAKDTWCHVQAMMDEDAVIGKKASVEVTLSRDVIIRAMGVSGRGKVDAEKEIIVQVIARKHCIVSGEPRLEIPVPAEGEETLLFFDVLPKHEGVGEVNVIVRQGNRPIVNLKLHPRFVKRRRSALVEHTVAQAEIQPLDSRRELPNVLYIREGEMGAKRVLHFQFESRKLNKIVQCTSEPFEDVNARQDYITNLYEEIESFWAEDDLEYSSFMSKIQARGVAIFDKLMPRELQRVLWDDRDNIKTIQVFSDEPFIPWELAYLKEPGKKARRDSHFLAEKGMVRWLTELQEFPPPKLRLREKKVGYVIPNYPKGSHYELPGAQEERKMLKALFSAQSVTPTSDKVQAALEEPGRFDILHFACHGIADTNSIWNAGLMMKGSIKNNAYQKDNLMSSQIDAFAELKEADVAGPLVFLNACQVGRQGYNLTGTGGFARAFLKSGAGAFVSTHWAVGDTPALDFSQTFYEELLAGKNMMTAVSSARKAAKNNEELTWLSYVVYADPYAKFEKLK